MPLALISTLSGVTDAQTRAVIASVTDALAQSLSVDKAAVRVLITEVPASSWGVAGIAIADRQAGRG